MRPSRSSRPNTKTSLVQDILRNELGQMSIFLALVFQVLFVFFAMVINIGLLVHDKINLQNSVDLGAYYAAQKQAEILNEIAHLNYQIRQDYKLLAWRYWVLGTIGRDGQGSIIPASRNPNGIPADTPRLYVTELGGPPAEEVPVACLATPQWWEFAMLSAPGTSPNENYCWHSYNWVSSSIPIPSVGMTVATAGVNAWAAAQAQSSQGFFTQSCDEASPLSWAFVATIMTTYKYSVAYKKKAIKALRANLVSANPTDREGRSIRDGVIQTIRKNLTESNLQSFDASSVQMLNGLTRGSCDLNGGERTLPEILTAPGLYFALLRSVGPTCTFDLRFQTQFNAVPGGVGRWDPSSEMRNKVGGEPGPDDQFHSTLGFEKNPWCMAYMGVKANTSPRKPFAPFGKSVDLVARAFAQPFGGRIGPWYAKKWDQPALMSGPVPQPQPAAPGNPAAAAFLNPAPGQEDRTDPLTSPRLTPGSGAAYMYSPFSIPNFSRFPGDQLGLRSNRAQARTRRFFSQTVPTIPASIPNFGDRRVRLNWLLGWSNMQTTGDALAFDEPSSTSGFPAMLLEYRDIEMSAVAPDLFDLTYYSIDPAANLNYTEIARNIPARYGIGGAPMGDLGSRQTANQMRAINVETQIAAANGTAADPNLRPATYWVVEKWEHLLNSWAPHRASNFSFPTDRFGKCPVDALPTAMIPGRCAAGGRVGYSVRLISRDHLNAGSSSDLFGRPGWQIGGDGAAPGPILNPPGGDAQF